MFGRESPGLTSTVFIYSLIYFLSKSLILIYPSDSNSCTPRVFFLPDVDLFCCWQAFARVPAVPVPGNLYSNGDPKEWQQQEQ